MNYEWSGQPLREMSVEFTAPMTDEALAYWRLPHNDEGERTVRVQLQPGQSWMSAGPKLKKGRAVSFTMTGIGRDYTFEGRVKYRRGPRLVVVGHVR